jgi:Flp pilus assembly CpaF family ATPase
MDTIKIPINDETFGKLYPYIIDDLITDIRWNGRFLMIEHLTKGYMKTDDVLSEEWLSILTKNIATSNDLNFNPTQPSLDASTDDLRFHVYHPSITGENKTILSIRKTSKSLIDITFNILDFCCLSFINKKIGDIIKIYKIYQKNQINFKFIKFSIN